MYFKLKNKSEYLQKLTSDIIVNRNFINLIHNLLFEQTLSILILSI